MRYSHALRCGNTFAFLLQIVILNIISIAELENVPPTQDLQKRATFSTPIIGLAETGDQTRATCVAGSVARRSAIHYDHKLYAFIHALLANYTFLS
jgi:hypothetical protein